MERTFTGKSEGALNIKAFFDVDFETLCNEKKIYSSLKPYVLSDESSKWKPKAVNKKDN